jgi:hypothetical protein
MRQTCKNHGFMRAKTLVLIVLLGILALIVMPNLYASQSLPLNGDSNLTSSPDHDQMEAVHSPYGAILG